MTSVEAIAVRDGRGGVHMVTVPVSASSGTPLTILRAGICGTDLQIASRVREDRAGILGHEALAVTESIEPVILNPVGIKDQDSILGHDYDGVFRQRCQISSSEDGGPTLVPANAELIADLAPLVEPLGAALYGWELVEKALCPRRVGIWGGGFLGLACATIAGLHGADVVVFCSTDSRAAWIRRRLSLRAESLPSSPEIGTLDAAFLCVPRTSAVEALDQAAQVICSDGAVDLVGGVPRGVVVGSNPDADATELRRGNVRGVSNTPNGTTRVRREDGRWLYVTGHRGTSDGHLLQAQEVLSQHSARFSRMISHVVSLRQGARMINQLCLGRSRTDAVGEEIVKVVIDPGQTVERRDLDPGVSIGHLLLAA
jgi:2-epi-valiolone-7-phosphate 1-reductase